MMEGNQDQDVNDIMSAVHQGNLERVKELINSFGLSYSPTMPTWSEENALLCDAIENKHAAVAKLLLTSGVKINNKNNFCYTPLHFAVINGDIEIVEMLLDKDANIDAKNPCGRTPLYDAIENEKMELIELLLIHGADVNARDNDGKSPLYVAVKRGCLQIVERLLKDGADANAKDNDGISLLDFAAQKGCLQSVDCLLKYGAHVTCEFISTWRSKGYAPLHFAVEKGSKEVAMLLLSRGASVDVKAKYGITPLHIAAKKGYTSIAEDLLNHGACIDSATLRKGYTPLHFATEQGAEEAVKLFLNRGADINAASTNGKLTPLHIATQREHEKVVKLLLQLGANVDYRNKCGKTVLQIAVKRGNLRIVEDVLKYCPNINNQSNRNSLKTAVYGAEEDIVKALLDYGITVKPKDANNSKFVEAAIGKGYLKIVEDLLKYGADVNTSSFGSLHVAANNEQEEVAKSLIRCGADVNARDLHGKTPIYYAINKADSRITKLLLNTKANIKDYPGLLNIAVERECIEIVELLLQHGADINASDSDGKTALHFTALHGYVSSCYNNRFYRTGDDNIKGDIAKLLLSKGANVDAETNEGETTLHAASRNGCAPVVEALLEYNANVNFEVRNDRLGRITSLHLAALMGNEKIVTMLLNKGADVNAERHCGATALCIATEAGYIGLVRVLLEHNANVECKSVAENYTPLQISAREGREDITTMLVQKGANVNAKREDGVTALHLASRKGHKGVVKILLDCGARVDFKNKKGITPLVLAATNGHAEIVETLLEYGSDINITSNNTILDLVLDKKVYEVLIRHVAKIRTQFIC